MSRLSQELQNPSLIFQICMESTLKEIRGNVSLRDYFLVFGTTQDQFDKRMLAVKSRLREKNFTINDKKSNLKPIVSASFLR